MTNDSLMKVKSIAECSPWSILQYFWLALSDNWSLNQFWSFLRVVVLDSKDYDDTALMCGLFNVFSHYICDRAK